MFLTGNRLMSASQRAYCVHIFKQIVRSWRFSSTVSTTHTECNGSALELSENKTTLRKVVRKRRLQEPGHTNAKAIQKVKYDSVHVVNKNTAGAIAGLVNNIFDEDDVILEFNAGSGVLSTALLKSGMKHVVALEPDPQFTNTLQVIRKTHKKSFNFFHKTIDEVMSYSDKELSKHLPSMSINKEGCNVQIIGHVHSWQLLIGIARRTRDVNSFLLEKSVNLCLCLPEISWKQFLDSKIQKLCVVERVLFMLAFDYEILARFRRSDFHINVKNKRQQMALNPSYNMVLVQIKTKQSKKFDLLEMQMFLTQFHNCQSRNRLVIPSLEQWSPSCGEELVRRGMPVFTRFSDLTPEELLEVFLYFRSLPNVEQAGFLVEWKSADS